ncbi:MAG: tRNA pseudouridine(55) synthase TruB, partial [Clostridiales bacterium]|nr:tRNA pseudouridine(55) synthase TruB [Clostridiales bacterium]
TRAVEFAENSRKEYVAGLRLGQVTDTQDVTGETLESHPVTVSREDVEAAMARFLGPIQQVPPMYSAVKINGQKLYDLARKGREVAREPRPITIHELTFLGFEEGNVRLQVSCSKGTYIRTLCKDIGEALGCGACMGSLRRTQAGDYTLADAVPLETLLESEHPEQYLRPVDSLFSSLSAVTLTANQEKRCRNGNAFSVTLAPGTYRAYSRAGEFLMLAQVREGTMTTVKSFFEPDEKP